MPKHFKTWFDFYNFRDSVTRSRRFIHEGAIFDFLDTLLTTSKSRHRVEKTGGAVWRAQLGTATQTRDVGSKGEDGADDIEVLIDFPYPYSEERMVPRRDAAYEGRVNPKGIPCLYVASDKNTAMSEVRPGIGMELSLGQFRLAKDLKLIDFSVGHTAGGGIKFLFDAKQGSDLDEAIWQQIDYAFSTPVNPTDATAEYVPTQVIAEFFRAQGFDGVVYKSKLGPGLNYALFDLDAVELMTCSVVSVHGVEYEFGGLTETYFTKRSRPAPAN